MPLRATAPALRCPQVRLVVASIDFSVNLLLAGGRRKCSSLTRALDVLHATTAIAHHRADGRYSAARHFPEPSVGR